MLTYGGFEGLEQSRLLQIYCNWCDHFFDLLRRFILGVGRRMTIDIGRDAGLGMTGSLLHGVDRHPHLEQKRDRGVTQVMKSDGR